MHINPQKTNHCDKMNKLGLLLGVFFVCYFSVSAQNNNAPINKIGYYEVGMASYYPGNEDRRKTFSGDVYDMAAMEAAHRTMPFGALVKVTNLENQKEVILRINDRPNTTERLMDMTLAAADSLGMIKEDKAVIPVKIEIIALDIPRTNDTKKYLATAPAPKVEVKKVEKELSKAEKLAAAKAEKQKQVADEKKQKVEKLAAAKAEKEKKKATEKAEKDKKLAEAKKQKAEKLEAAKAEKDEKMLEAKAEKDKKVAAKAEKGTVAGLAKNTEKIAAKSESEDKNDKFAQLFKADGNYSVEGKKQKPTGFGIQTGNFAELNKAIAEAKTIEALKIGTVYIQTTADKGKASYKVLVGNFKDKEAAKETVKLLAEKKYSPFTKKY